MSKVIKVEFTTASITEALKELRAYKRDFQRKVEKFRKEVAKRIRRDAQTGFNHAIAADYGLEGERKAEVHVTNSSEGNISVIVANGEDAIFVEFGAGVFHNGAAGISPHPLGAEHGFVIGGYGKHYGRRKAWGYYDEAGNLIITHGTPAAMPMHKAFLKTYGEIYEIAKEVFSK